MRTDMTGGEVDAVPAPPHGAESTRAPVTLFATGALPAWLPEALWRCGRLPRAVQSIDLDETAASGSKSILLVLDRLDDASRRFLLALGESSTPPAVTVVATTPDDDLAAAVRAAGILSYLVAPVTDAELIISVDAAAERRRLRMDGRLVRAQLNDIVQTQRSRLSDTLADLERRQGDLRDSQLETVRRLCIAAEFRDDETPRHIERMSRYVAAIARAAGIGEDGTERLRLASQMHDVGKIGLPDGLVSKTGALTPDERQALQRHCVIGYRILGGSRSDLLETAASIALTHHERVDGDGYPHGLAHDEIPLEGRIAAIADVFDALTTDRPYRGARGIDEALSLMSEERGRHFDAWLLGRFHHCLPEILEIRAELAD